MCVGATSARGLIVLLVQHGVSIIQRVEGEKGVLDLMKKAGCAFVQQGIPGLPLAEILNPQPPNPVPKDFRV